MAETQSLLETLSEELTRLVERAAASLVERPSG